VIATGRSNLRRLTIFLTARLVSFSLISMSPAALAVAVVRCTSLVPRLFFFRFFFCAGTAVERRTVLTSSTTIVPGPGTRAKSLPSLPTIANLLVGWT
jgi:hypothetical protein